MITVTASSTSGTVVGSASGTMPGSYWCDNASVATNLNGGCP